MEIMAPALGSDTLTPCPLCRAKSRKERHAKWLLVCGVCGASLVPNVTQATSDPEVLSQLSEAKRLRANAFMRRIAMGFAIAGFLGFIFATLIVTWFSVTTGVLSGVIAACCAMAALMLSRSASSLDHHALEHVQGAWGMAVSKYLESRPGKSVPELAKELDADPAMLTPMLERQSRYGNVRLDVRNDGTLEFDDARPRVATEIADPLEEEFAELERAEAQKTKPRVQ